VPLNYRKCVALQRLRSAFCRLRRLFCTMPGSLNFEITVLRICHHIQFSAARSTMDCSQR